MPTAVYQTYVQRQLDHLYNGHSNMCTMAIQTSVQRPLKHVYNGNSNILPAATQIVTVFIYKYII